MMVQGTDPLLAEITNEIFEHTSAEVRFLYMKLLLFARLPKHVRTFPQRGSYLLRVEDSY